jgi:hypothetical protein
MQTPASLVSTVSCFCAIFAFGILCCDQVTTFMRLFVQECWPFDSSCGQIDPGQQERYDSACGPGLAREQQLVGAVVEFYAVLEQVLDLLRQRGRVSYRALKVQFNLDDDHLAALQDELIDAQGLARDEDGKVLVWRGDAAPALPVPEPAPAPLAYTPLHLTEKILTARRALEGERKQVTVLFADVKDSTRG